MIRSILFFLGLLSLAAAPAVAQVDVRRVGGSAQLIAYLEGPQMMTATPKWWRDSVLTAWAAAVSPIGESLNAQLLPGARTTLVLRLRRNGDLHSVRLEGTSGLREVDSLLLAAVHGADEALRFPALPATVEGAGVELRILIATPIPRMTGIHSRHLAVDVAPPTPACRDSLARPTSFRTAPLRMRIDTVTGGTRSTIWGGLVIQALAEQWDSLTSAVPDAVPTLLREGTRPFTGFLLIQGTLRLRFDGTGHLLDASVPWSTHYPALDSALLLAAARVEAARAFPPPPSTEGDTATLDLSLEEGRPTANGQMVLGTTRAAEWIAPDSPHLVTPGRVRYPADLRNRGVQGRVELEFMIDRDGKAIPASIIVLSSAHPGLISPAVDAIRETRFTPGMIRGCPVPMVVRQGINFNR